MMSVETIKSMAREAAEEAAETGQTPFVYWNAAEVDDYSGFPFPFLGDYVPEDWELVKEHFADSSGLGAPDEPALTVGQLKSLIKNQIAETNGATGWALTRVGQFQVYVGEYRRT